MPDYKVIKSSVLSNLTDVRFYEETVEHIKTEHQDFPVELPTMMAAIENCIVSPTHVEESYSNSVVFVDKTSTNKAGDPLRVPVKILSTEQNAGRVRTAFFATGNGTPKIIWRKP